MNKQEFLTKLRDGLSGLPQKDIEERISFYSEMIDDRIEEGMDQQKAIDEIGSVDEIISRILEETPLSTLVKEKAYKKRNLKTLEIVLIILGSPIWFSLLIAAISIIFAVYTVIWSALISLWAIEVSFAACVLGMLAASIIFALRGKFIIAIASVGLGLIFAGLTIFLFFGCKAFTKGIFVMTKKIAIYIKSLFVGKGQNNE